MHSNPLADINIIYNLRFFIRLWDSKKQSSSQPIKIGISDDGNYNFTGAEDSFTAPALTRWHPSFALCIEPGVRELVICLIEKFNCITFSSCEGHNSSATGVFSARHVSIVPRNNAEFTRYTQIFSEIAAQINKDLPCSVIIESRKIMTNDGPTRNSVDIIFGGHIQTTHNVGKDLEDVYMAFLEKIKKYDSEKYLN